MYYILFCFFIFTNYLFSQVEENEIINTDTIIGYNIDSVVATKIDTTIFSEPVNEIEEKTDLSKYNFYNDYLADLKKTSLIHSDIADTLAINDCKNIGIISAKFGSLILLVNAGFITWDILINCKTTIATKVFYGGTIFTTDDIFSGFGLGVGYVPKKTGNVIIKGNIYVYAMYFDKRISYDRFGINLGMDVIWKVFSVGIDTFVFKDGFLPLLTLGLNIILKLNKLNANGKQ